MLRVAAAVVLLLPAAAAGPLPVVEVGTAKERFYAGSVQPGEVQGPEEGPCADLLTPLALEAQFVPGQPTDRVLVRIRALVEEERVELVLVLTPADPAAEAEFVSEDRCPHFAVEGLSVGTTAPWVVRVSVLA